MVTTDDVAFNAGASININGVIDATGNDITLTAKGTSPIIVPDVNYEIPTGSITIGNNGALKTTAGGTIMLNAQGNSVALADLDFLSALTGLGVDLGGLADVLKLHFGNVFVNGNGYIDANGGNIDINNKGILKASANSLRTTGTGTINLEQNSGAGLTSVSALISSLTSGSIPAFDDIFAFGSIQNAIDAVNTTGNGLNTIEVSAGIYAGGVNADHNNLLLKGKQAGVELGETGRDFLDDLINDPVATLTALPATETIVTVGDHGFNVTGKNVTVDGFLIGGVTDGVKVSGADAKIQNNVIALTSGSGVSANGATNLSVTDNVARADGAEEPGRSILGRGGAGHRAVRNHVRAWQFLTLQPDRMGLPVPQQRTGGRVRLAKDGSNIADYLLDIQRLDEEHKTSALEGIVRTMEYVLPYARDLQAALTSELERKAYLQLTEGSFKVPGWMLSTGTLRVLALLATLRHPQPPPLVLVEEIENGLDLRSIHLLVEEFRTAVLTGVTQVVLTTHSPYPLDLLKLDQLVLLTRDDAGEPRFHRPASDEGLQHWAREFAPGRLYTMGTLHEAAR